MKLREIRMAPFLVGTISFFLPFIDITCSGEKMMAFTGIQLVTGTEFESGFDGSLQNIPPEPFAVIALLIFLGGVLIAYMKSELMKRHMITVSVSAFVSMLLLKMRIDDQVVKSAEGMPLMVEYKSGYLMACLAALTGIGLAFYKQKEGGIHDDEI